MIRSQRKLVPALTCVWGCLIGLLVAAEHPHAQEKSFLWQVRSEQGTLYLLGSIHFLKKEHFPLNKAIDEAFERSGRLVLEIDIKSADPVKIQQLTLQKGMNTDGTTLRQNVSQETYSLAERRAKQLGMDLRSLAPFRPWLVALTMQSLMLQRLGLSTDFGVDRYLAGRAEKAGKPVAGLETAEFQIGLFDQFSLRDQELMLRETLKELDVIEKNVERIVQMWLKGNVSALEDLLLAGMREYPEVHQKLLVDRHRRWLPQIEKMIQRGDRAIVVVGAAHLVGKDGVIALLRERGYTVEQL